jgi:hypothetical protein
MQPCGCHKAPYYNSSSQYLNQSVRSMNRQHLENLGHAAVKGVEGLKAKLPNPLSAPQMVESNLS